MDLRDARSPARAGALQRRRVALIIWWALVAGLLVFTAVATLVGPRMWRQANPAAPLLAAIAVGLACVEFAMSRFVPSRATGNLADAPPGARALSMTIIAAALNEGAGLFGAVTWLLGGLPPSLLAIAIALFGLLLAFPSRARWQAMGGGPAPSTESRGNPLVR